MQLSLGSIADIDLLLSSWGIACIELTGRGVSQETMPLYLVRAAFAGNFNRSYFSQYSSRINGTYAGNQSDYMIFRVVENVVCFFDGLAERFLLTLKCVDAVKRVGY